MITLVGHGYIGNAIAHALRERGILFNWAHHGSVWITGPVINAAGYTGHPNVDACETRRWAAYSGNVEWPIALEALAGDYPVIHIGSGCVYEGEQEGGFTEEDEPNFFGSFYSTTKICGQKGLQKYLHKSYLLRIRMPFGVEPHPKNLMTKLAAYPKLVNGLNSLSRIEDVARVAVHFATTLPPAGIYNVVNPGAIETREIAHLMGWIKAWFEPKEFEESVLARRSFCVLNSNKLQAVFPLDEVRTALTACIPETLAEPVAA